MNTDVVIFEAMGVKLVADCTEVFGSLLFSNIPVNVNIYSGTTSILFFLKTPVFLKATLYTVDSISPTNFRFP